MPRGTRPAEIGALLDRLVGSGCEFGRNGEWHGGLRAREHLLMKHSYMRRQKPDISAEEFIALGASASFATRQPYQVRCGSREMRAADWLHLQLLAMRAQASPSRSPVKPERDGVCCP